MSRYNSNILRLRRLWRLGTLVSDPCPKASLRLMGQGSDTSVPSPCAPKAKGQLQDNLPYLPFSSFIKFTCHEESPRSLLNINHFSLSRHKPFGKTIIAGHCHSRLYCIIEAGRKLSLRDINYLPDLHLPRPFHLKLHGTHRMPPLILLH